LPGKYGIGDLGPAAYTFADYLESAGQRLWQVLPLGPTGYGDSPYQCFSAFAGNPLLVSPERLVSDGLLAKSNLKKAPEFSETLVNFGDVIPFRAALLEKAATAFFGVADDESASAYEAFCLQHGWWLDDYALFMAVKAARNYAAWTEWPPDLRARDPETLHVWHDKFAEPIRTTKFTQFQFWKQWHELRTYCAERDIRLMGDIPIYPPHDSADVWANQDLFQLNGDGTPSAVAGVPPDYFSATGQLWGNPLYDWDRVAERGFDWWIARIRETLALVDIVRIDHFRGFESYWSVPADEETAINGEWIPGPGDALFDAIHNALGELPIAAENLGVITDEVEALRERHELPGMAVLQFAFGEDAASSGLLPHTWTNNTIAYTGTHDNDTTIGWWKANEKNTTLDSKTLKRQRAYATRYMNLGDEELNWACIRTVMASVADTAIFPLQDVLGLGTMARLNAPGTSGGRNWRWRFTKKQLKGKSAKRLRELTETYGRLL
jgi:4-alpha-glucanotransferase